MKVNRNFGLGSFSSVFAMIGILFAVLFGDQLVELIGLNAWSNGDSGIHYTVFYALPLFAIAFFLGYKYPEDFGAKTGKVISSVVFVITILALFSF